MRTKNKANIGGKATGKKQKPLSLFELMKESYELETPELIKERILLKLLVTIANQVCKVTGPADESEQAKALRALQYQWKVAEYEQLYWLSKSPLR